MVAQFYATDRPSIERWLASAPGKAHDGYLREQAGPSAGALRSRILSIEASQKPYGLESLRAFD